MKRAVTLSTAAIALAMATSASAAEPTVIPLSRYLGVLLSFDADMGSGQSERFLLDTGGGITVISQDLADRIHCAPWGRITGFRMRGDRVDMARCDDVAVRAEGTTLTPPTVGVLDFSRLLPPSAPPLGGSIALDAFAGEVVTLDLAHMRLVIETPETLELRIQDAREVRMRFAREANGLALTPLVAARTTRGVIWPELDSGSDGAVILNRPLAKAGKGRATASEPPSSITLANGMRIVAPITLDDLVIDGNIGLDVLRRWTVTIDTVHQRMWWKRATDEDEPESR